MGGEALTLIMPSGIYKRKPISEERKKEIFTDEWKKKQSEAHKGQKPWNTGKKRAPFSQEWIDKISKNLQPDYWKGRKQKPETVEKRRLKLIGKKRTDEQRATMGLSRRGVPCPNGSMAKIGDKNPSWKGGVTPINTKIRMSAEYKEWRMLVLRRDRFTCVLCGIKNGMGKKISFEVDHIKRFSDYPELRLVVENGRTLCKPCHYLTDNYGNKKKLI